MRDIKAKVVLLDIEGTTTSISFVKDILFPYVKQHSRTFLENFWTDSSVQALVKDLVRLPQYTEFANSAVSDQPAENVDTANLNHCNIADFVNYLTDKNSKVTPLKKIQGHIWSIGYVNNTLNGHVYDDVPGAFKRWRQDGLRIAIYSSGSVEGQKLLFGKTDHGNLLPYIEAHFDTNSGHKQEATSYKNIASALDVEACDVLFLTDVVGEAEAARSAGMQTVILNRPGNAPLGREQQQEFLIVNDFDALKLRAN